MKCFVSGRILAMCYSSRHAEPSDQVFHTLRANALELNGIVLYTSILGNLTLVSLLLKYWHLVHLAGQQLGVWEQASAWQVQ